MAAGQLSRENNGDEEEINVYLKVMKTVALAVKKSDTVRNVKAKLNDKEGISEGLQELFFSGERLRDNQNLVNCGIQQNSTLQLFVQNMVPVRLFIKMPTDQKIIEVKARTFDTILNIKSHIVAEEGNHLHNVNLIYAGKLLEDDKTLASLNIQGDSTLHMAITPRDKFPICVKMLTGEILRIEVKMMYTVRDVKTIVERIAGFSLNDLSLTHDGMQLEDSKTLSSYNITQGFVLQVSPKSIQVFVKKWCGKTLTLDVCLEDLVKNVKDKIYHKLGMPANVQGLMVEGKRLDDCRNLASYSIQKHSTIHLAIWSSSAQCKMILQRQMTYPPLDFLHLIYQVP
ncbi:hypothetical protein ACH5RR_031544 [Cinchona calisaya]|uniref:Ubiquitin-like domain-containing protein n=1 Tax=Cinchona calisaya TaxID=153742 RepID=A0ABD2YJZ3_9GENT